MEKQTFYNVLFHGSTRGTQQATFIPHALWHQMQKLQMILFFIFYYGSILSVANNATTSLGSSLALNGSTILHLNETLVSDNGQFTLGFYPNVDGDYNLAILYAKGPKMTHVWEPYSGITLTMKSLLLLSEKGDLQVQDSNSLGSYIVWNTRTELMNITTATILNTGNLILYNKTMHVLWQSFDYPTNTLLPNQIYSSNNKGMMYSWKDEGIYFTRGEYVLKWNTLNKLELHYHEPNSEALVPYWSYTIPSLSYPGAIRTTSVVLTPNGEFQAIIAPNIHNVIGKSTINTSDYLRRITLDVDGQLRMYSWQIGASKDWTIEWIGVSNTCEIFGWCGPFAVCVAGECECPRDFKYIDITDKKKGCVRIRSPNFCNKPDIVDDLVALPGDYPYGKNMAYYDNVSVEYCKGACINACLCQRATISYPDANGNVQCWLTSDDPINGRYQTDRTTYLRMAPISIPKSNNRILSYSTARLNTFIGGPFMIIFGIISCIFGYTIIHKKINHFQLRKLEMKLTTRHGTLLRFSSKEIRLMTNNFAKEIGKGGYGTVFKGKIGCHTSTKQNVAIKRLDKLDVDEKEFINDVDIIGRIHHANLTHLLGYCAEKNDKIFVYEYMEQHSLDKVLFQNKTSKAFVLDWHTRFNIAIQTTKGLAYLHNDVREHCIIHCDIKPENILLDSMFCAKVADFGMSRIMNREQTHTVTRQIRGTFGYLAPEWTSDQMSITTKIDVYSYGMVLLEIVGGRRNLKTTSSDTDDVDSDWYFPLWAYSKMSTIETMFEVLDPLLFGFANPLEVERILRVAFWCINDRPHLRPSMSMVVQMLEGHMPIEVPVPPPKFLLDIFTSSKDEDYDAGIHKIFTTSL